MSYIPCPNPEEEFVNVVEDGFGFYINESGKKEIVYRYTFTNQNHLTVQVITYGAIITSIKYPDQCGVLEDIVLGFDDIEGYMSKSNPYMGAVVGRVANRISKGHFKINEDHFQLSTNSGEHHLHGGFRGFDKVNWKSDLQGKKLVLTYLSKDGEEGYPGEVLVSATYQMTTDNQFLLDMKATTSKPTPINLTNHTYFNLAGHAAGAKGLLEHLVCINADRYLTTDEDSIPTGCIQNVTGTMWDLRIPKKLGSVLHHVPYGGYDQCMCIHNTESESMTFNARVVHPESGRTLEVYSNQPGVQFYTANKFPKQVIGGVVVTEGDDILHVSGLIVSPNVQLSVSSVWKQLKQIPRVCPGGKCGSLKLMKLVKTSKNSHTEVEVEKCPIRICPQCGYVVKDADFENPPGDCCSEEKLHLPEKNKDPVKIVRLVGKNGAEYNFHGAFCLMTENYPDSVHRKNFPNSILRPGEMYHHIVHYKFGLFEDVTLEPEDKELQIEEWEGEASVMLDVDDKNDDLLDEKLEENGR